MDQHVTVAQASPDVDTIYRRAHCLGALVQRREFEQIIQGFNEMSIVEIHKGMATELGQWLEQEGLLACFSEQERGLLAIPLGHWRRELLELVGWLVETLGVCVWALSLIKLLPPYDERFSSEELLLRLRIGKPLKIPETLRLRSMKELQTALQSAQLWESRMKAVPHHRGAGHTAHGGVSPSTSTPAVKQADKGRKNGHQPDPVEQEFSAFGRPYRSLTSEQTDLLRAITESRAAALRWLCGQ